MAYILYVLKLQNQIVSRFIKNLSLIGILNCLVCSILLIPIIPSINFVGYEQVKVILFIILTTILGFVWWFGLFFYPKIFLLKINLTLKFALVFIIILLVTSFLGFNPKDSILGTSPYFQGFLTYLYLFFFGLVIYNLKLKLYPQIYVWLLSGGVVSIISILDFLRLNLLQQFVPTYSGRVVSTFGQPNFYAGFLVLLLPLLKMVLHKSRWWYLLAIILIVSILISQSRIAIGITCILLFGDLNLRILKKRFLIISIILASLFLEYFLWLIINVEVISPNLDKNLYNTNPEKRIYIWRVIPEIVEKRLAFGYGLENIDLAYKHFFKTLNFNINQDPLNLTLRDLHIDRTHNYLLDLFIFSGILGLLSWVLLIFLILFRAIRYKGQFYLNLSLGIYLFWVLIQNQSIVHLIYFWWLIAVIDNQIKVRNDSVNAQG